MTLVLLTLACLAVSCGGPKANVKSVASGFAIPSGHRRNEAPAIVRQLPRYFEATGSLAGDIQTDTQPQTSGKVIAVGVDLGSYVKRGQMIVQLEPADSKLQPGSDHRQLESAKAAVKQGKKK